MLTDVEEKKQYFNQYWQTRHLPSADSRSLQRAELVCSLLPEDKSGQFLDIGCGRGMVIEYLVEKGYKVGGCDLSSDTVYELRNKGCDAFIFDIEQDEFLNKYDGLICLEVLQQLFDPVAALVKFSKALNKGGFLIVSVPNEFHIWSRLCLLFGNSRLGHFDESHLRLFTPHRARQLFKTAGLEADRVISVPIVPPKMRGLNRLGRILAGITPSLFSLSQIYRLKCR